MSNRRNFDLSPRGHLAWLKTLPLLVVENARFFYSDTENDTTKGLGPFWGRMQAHLGFVRRNRGCGSLSFASLWRFPVWNLGRISVFYPVPKGPCRSNRKFVDLKRWRSVAIIIRAGGSWLVREKMGNGSAEGCRLIVFAVLSNQG